MVKSTGYKQVITKDDILKLPIGTKFVDVAKGSIITPLARDLAAERGIEFRQSERSEVDKSDIKPVILLFNWKGYFQLKGFLDWFENLVSELNLIYKAEKGIIEAILVLPFPVLILFQELITGKPYLHLCAPDMFYEPDEGAYTGEISVEMLKDIGCEYLLVGHADRRQYFDETDELIARKIKLALKAGLKLILAVFEDVYTREKTYQELKRQLYAGTYSNDMMVVYQAAWSDRKPRGYLTPPLAAEIVNFIRQTTGDRVNHVLINGQIEFRRLKEFIELGINGFLFEPPEMPDIKLLFQNLL